MSAASLVRDARADGLSLSLTERGTVKFKGPQRAVVKWTPILKRHKGAIVALLQADAAPGAVWDASDWRAYYHERAGVSEYDGGLSRSEAERQAYLCCVSEWLCRNPATSEPGACAQCQRGDLPMRAVMPYGDEMHGHCWLHGECWAQWWAQRREAAVAALEGFGIVREASR